MFGGGFVLLDICHMRRVRRWWNPKLKPMVCSGGFTLTEMQKSRVKLIGPINPLEEKA